MGRPLEIPAKGRAVQTFAVETGVWTLYELPGRDDYEGSSPLWHPFKLMLPPDTPIQRGRRRSYPLTWNAHALRMRRDYDSHALELGQPDLFMRVETFMSLSYDCGWLVSNQGMTVAEIEAEVRRLAAMARERRARKRALKAEQHSS